MAFVDAVFPYLIGLSLASVVAVFVTGVVGMSKGGAFNEKYGNKLMRWRVLTQGIAVSILLVYFLLHHL
jgi:hypothetical protein